LHATSGFSSLSTTNVAAGAITARRLLSKSLLGWWLAA